MPENVSPPKFVVPSIQKVYNKRNSLEEVSETHSLRPLQTHLTCKRMPVALCFIILQHVGDQMNLESYILRLEQYLPNMDLAPIIKAYHYAEKAHEGQFRKSGEPYFIHPVEVSLVLAELEMDAPTIIGGLLHDVVEDTDTSTEEIAEAFGDDVAHLVDGVTKLGQIKYETKEEQQAENLRKMFMAMAKDIRVILIKLADRLHNLRTLKYMADHKKREKASESLEIYAPIAHRLGISKIKWEMEDLSLLYLDPEGYYDLVNKVNKKRAEREQQINNIMDILRNAAEEVHITCEIYGRPKNFYSIYKKMKHQHKEFDEIYDLTAVRVIVESVKDCYGILGVVHTKWKPIPGRFKDYVAMPKPNMYQSLHTTVIGEGGDPFEIQIRTWEMHRVSEYGIAAHWKYKEGKNGGNLDDKLAWLRQTMEWHNEISEPTQFVESLKMDIFNTQVYVFTPKGSVFELPLGSTPVDFAYKIHTEVGNHCVGAKVNNRIVPLNFQLKNGQIVEIMTNKSSNGPSRDWLKFVKTTQAKNRIKQWFKKERREENIEKGRDMFEKEIKRNGFVLKDLIRPKWIDPILKRLSLKDMDELYATIGYGGILISQVLPRLREKHREEQKAGEPEEDIREIIKKKEEDRGGQKKDKSSHGIVVKGIDNVLVRFGRCCNPVPGDDIIGYVTRGRGVTVHRSDCTNFEKTDDSDNRFIEVFWDSEEQSAYSTEIQIYAPDRKGLLSEITLLISETSLMVTGVNAKLTKNEIAVINLTIEINNTEQLTKLIKKLQGMPGIIDVKRVTS